MRSLFPESHTPLFLANSADASAGVTSPKFDITDCDEVCILAKIGIAASGNLANAANQVTFTVNEHDADGLVGPIPVEDYYELAGATALTSSTGQLGNNRVTQAAANTVVTAQANGINEIVIAIPIKTRAGTINATQWQVVVSGVTTARPVELLAIRHCEQYGPDRQLDLYP